MFDMFPGGKPPMEDFISSWYPILIALTFGLIVGVRNYFKGCPNPSIEKLTDKVVVITGATKGMGKQIAIDMALRGAKIYMPCRDTSEGTKVAKEIISETRNENIVVMHMDLAKLKTVKQFVHDFKALESKVHLLINNAGVMCYPQTKTEDGNDFTMQVNYIGPFLLTHLLVDCLVAARPSRVINTTCHAARIGSLRLDDLNHQAEGHEYKPQEMYAQSKLAVTLFTRHMALYLEGTDVTVNVVSPGVVNTDFYNEMPIRQNKFLNWSFFPITWMFMKTAKDGAQTAMYISVCKEEQGVSGKLYNECRVQDFVGEATSQEISQQLWEKTFPLAGIDMKMVEDTEWEKLEPLKKEPAANDQGDGDKGDEDQEDGDEGEGDQGDGSSKKTK